ncbi:hypothetical protein [Paenibacillus foliorum]|nr:hypothetical protein [Paenibacillus foliorum]
MGQGKKYDKAFKEQASCVSWLMKQRILSSKNLFVPLLNALL